MKGIQFGVFDTPKVDPHPKEPRPTYLTRGEVKTHAILFLVLIAASVGWVLALASGLECQLRTLVGGECKDLVEGCWRAPSELRLSSMAIASGAAGGLIHAVTSFADFAGNRRLMHSWLPWLYLRAPVGALLAMAVYLGARGGVFGLEKITACSDVYLLVFMALLAGLFSKQVADKLADVVDVLFKPSRPPDRRDGLEEEAAAAGANREGFDETIHRAQVLLGELGLLPERDAEGRELANGVLGPETREAVAQFLAEQVGEEDRASVVGGETDPDYWRRVIELLEQAIRTRS